MEYFTDVKQKKKILYEFYLGKDTPLMNNGSLNRNVITTVVFVKDLTLFR